MIKHDTPEEKERNPKIICYDQEIEKDLVLELINTLQDYSCVDLFFSTCGGSVIDMEILIHSINIHPDIRIFLNFRLMSCGLELLWKTKVPIFIGESFEMVMFHTYDRSLYETRDVGYRIKELRKTTLKNNKKVIEQYKKLGMTEKQVEKFWKGKDVWWYRDDILKNLGKLKNVTIL